MSRKNCVRKHNITNGMVVSGEYYSWLLRIFYNCLTTVHDCRPEYVQDFRDQHQWEAYLFKHGLNRTYSDINSLHHTPRQEPGRKK